jgi:azurin
MGMRTVWLCVLLSAMAVGSGAASSPGQRREATARVIRIQVGDNLKFLPAAITAAPGELVKVVLTDAGQMPKLAMAHNFVLLKKGVEAKTVAEQSASARESGFIAPSVMHQVLASTTLVGPGETADTTFVTPIDPGEYEFICTFPGHFALGMKGILTVK